MSIYTKCDESSATHTNGGKSLVFALKYTHMRVRVSRNYTAILYHRISIHLFILSLSLSLSLVV